MEPDLLKAAAEPLRVALGAWLQGILPPAAHGGVGPAIDIAGLAALAVALAGLGVWTHARAGALRRLIETASGVAALAVAAWTVRHPSPDFDALFGRWDHLAFCGLGGLGLSALPHHARLWALAAISVGIVGHYVGPFAVAAVFGTGLAGWAVARAGPRGRPAAAVAVQVVLLLAVYAYCLRLRAESLALAWPLQGLLMWFALRHLSAMIEVARGARIAVRDYLAYVTFYGGSMGILGAPEVYAEFARRNLDRPGALEHRLAARRIVVGGAQGLLSGLIPISAAATLASTTLLQAWTNSLLLFVRTALFIMGAWALIEGGALFLGVRLRPNFFGLLRCENPSELWRSWRGTMTNWLIQHVYAPLGANRRHQSLNVLAAFGVSLVWHWLGVPFLTADFRPAYLAPISLWALLNALAVVAHLELRRRHVTFLPAGTPDPLRRGVKRLGTFALGSFAVTLPAFQGPRIDEFPAFLGVLLGFGR